MRYKEDAHHSDKYANDEDADETRKKEKAKFKMSTKWDNIDLDDSSTSESKLGMPSTGSNKREDSNKHEDPSKHEESSIPAEDDDTRKRLRQLEVSSFLLFPHPSQ